MYMYFPLFICAACMFNVERGIFINFDVAIFVLTFMCTLYITQASQGSGDVGTEQCVISGGVPTEEPAVLPQAPPTSTSGNGT